MGLPGSGKTFLSKELKKQLEALGKTVEWYNADIVREKFNDWDFSDEGRIRQSIRMKVLADSSTADFVISDFVAPIPEMRTNYNPDWTIWVDTIGEGRFEDTNKLFVPPETYDFRVTEKDSKKWAKLILSEITKIDIESKKLSDTIWRSVVKAYSYRMLGSLTTMTISFFVTGSFVVSMTIGFTEMILKPFIYWIHERIWNKIKWGRNG